MRQDSFVTCRRSVVVEAIQASGNLPFEIQRRDYGQFPIEMESELGRIASAPRHPVFAHMFLLLRFLEMKGIVCARCKCLVRFLNLVFLRRCKFWVFFFASVLQLHAVPPESYEWIFSVPSGAPDELYLFPKHSFFFFPLFNFFRFGTTSAPCFCFIFVSMS